MPFMDVFGEPLAMFFCTALRKEHKRFSKLLYRNVPLKITSFGICTESNGWLLHAYVSGDSCG